MPSANLGLANKVKKSYQGIDLDKKREEAIEGIGHSYVKTISWASFIGKLLTFCDEHNIKILKTYENHESGCLKFNTKLADVIPSSINFYIVSRSEEAKIAQRYDYYASKQFTKQNNKTFKDCYLFINKVSREVNGEKREGFNVYIQYSKRMPDGFDGTSIKGVVLSNSPVIDIESALKSGNATRGGNLNTPPSGIAWLLCETTVSDLFDLISELKTISAKAEEKYRTTRLAEASVFNLISKNLSDKFKPVVINGRHELKYKYWDTLIESSTALGLSKKVSKEYSNRDSSSVIKDVIKETALDEKTFIKYVKDFIKKWQEENNTSAIPQIKDFVHFRPDLTTNFANKNNVSCCVFTADSGNISCSIIIYTGKEGTEHSGKFALYVSSGAWGGYYRTTSSTKSKGFYPAWLDMSVENFEHVFNWIQTKAPDADDSLNESMTSRLGLSKKVEKHYQEKSVKDTIEDISVLDKPEFFKMCETIFSPENSEYITDTKKGIYDAKNDWDFWYVYRKGSDEYPKTAYIRVDGTKQGYMFTFYMHSQFGPGDLEYPIGRLNSAFDICSDMVDENAPDFEIWDCVKAMQHMDMTVENLLKVKDFFEQCCYGEILPGWVNKEYVKSYAKKWFSLKESNTSLGLSSKVSNKYQKKNSTDTIEDISVLDKEDFFKMCKKIFAPDSEFIVSSKKGPYISKSDWDFWYVKRRAINDDKFNKTAYIRVDNVGEEYMFTFYMASPNSGHEFTFPTGSSTNEIFEFLENSVDGWKNIPHEDKWACVKKMTHLTLTVENLLKAKEFFEEICREKLEPEYFRTSHFDREYVEGFVNDYFNLGESNANLGLSSKVKKEYSQKDSDETVIELSEMSFMEFYNALKNRLEVLGRDWQRDTKGKTKMFWWPIDFEDPDTRDKSRDSQWISMSFEGIGRFVFKLYSQYQIYPKYKNLAEDTFKASYTYSVQPSELTYKVKDVIFLTGDDPIQDPDASSFPFFKMTYGNLDKVIQWVSREVRKPRSSTDLKRLVQMS